MLKRILVVFPVFIILLGLLMYFSFGQNTNVVSPLGSVKKIMEKPLEKYSFENLKKKNFSGSEITIGKLLKDGDGFSSYMFYFIDNGKKVSGLINLPKNAGTYPVIVMFRGYVEREKYTTGEGTRRSAETIASNGFIALAPDFLGYGESDNPSNNSMEERFQTYTTALTLLASIKNLNKALDSHCHPERSEGSSERDSSPTAQNDNLCNIKADAEKIGIWGHSNGGHISLSVLAISGKNYPTVLWNPVSKPFPYSILYFTDEYDDHGKALRLAVANFEKDYDAEKYSPANYYKWINAPIQLNQAVDDESVPVKWSDQLNKNLTDLKKDVTYYTYTGENHNFNNGSWGIIIQRSINFYREYFSKKELNN